jgi:hypothetical protein
MAYQVVNTSNRGRGKWLSFLQQKDVNLLELTWGCVLAMVLYGYQRQWWQFGSICFEQAASKPLTCQDRLTLSLKQSTFHKARMLSVKTWTVLCRWKLIQVLALYMHLYGILHVPSGSHINWRTRTHEDWHFNVAGTFSVVPFHWQTVPDDKLWYHYFEPIKKLWCHYFEPIRKSSRYAMETLWFILTEEIQVISWQSDYVFSDIKVLLFLEFQSHNNTLVQTITVKYFRICMPMPIPMWLTEFWTEYHVMGGAPDILHTMWTYCHALFPSLDH